MTSHDRTTGTSGQGLSLMGELLAEIAGHLKRIQPGQPSQQNEGDSPTFNRPYDGNFFPQELGDAILKLVGKHIENIAGRNAVPSFAVLFNQDDFAGCVEYFKRIALIYAPGGDLDHLSLEVRRSVLNVRELEHLFELLTKFDAFKTPAPEPGSDGPQSPDFCPDSGPKWMWVAARPTPADLESVRKLGVRIIDHFQQSFEDWATCIKESNPVFGGHLLKMVEELRHTLLGASTMGIQDVEHSLSSVDEFLHEKIQHLAAVKSSYPEFQEYLEDTTTFVALEKSIISFARRIVRDAQDPVRSIVPFSRIS